MTDKDVISKICKFAYVSSIIGVCTLGICPAFGIMALSVLTVLKNKNTSLQEDDTKKLKKAKLLSVISLVLFVADIILAYVFTAANA